MSTRKMPEVIYHYTSSDVLLKILKSRSLRLAARHHLNDSMEGEQFFSVLKTHSLSPDNGKIDAIKKILLPLESYVACFSSSGDLLSQWRAYSENGTGVAIGFNKQAISQAIERSFDTLLYKVAYADNWEEFEASDNDRAKTITAMLKSSGVPKSGAIQAFAKEQWAIKTKGFSEEEESRLIVTIDASFGFLKTSTRGIKVDYFATATEVREFCEFCFGDFDGTDFINSITLGPKNRTNVDTLKRCLDSFGMSSVKINKSSISYR